MVTALASRTEGWAAGLQLAALSLRGQPDVAGFVAAFTGSHRYVLDYLAEEVLERQPEQVRAFLLDTSVLERLSGALCDAVTGRPGSQALLEQIERDGLFLVPLDEVRGWWRYHHLFADLLRARLEQQPGRAARAAPSAPTWYEQHGLVDDAIQHALAAGDMLWAARLIEEHFDTVFNLRGEGATIQRWLPGCPMTWSGPAPGCCWPRRRWRTMRATWTRWSPYSKRPSGRPPRGSGALRADDRYGGQPAGEHPRHIALHRSYLAQLRGRRRGTAAFAAQARPSRPGRADAELADPGVLGGGRVAARAAGRGRAGVRVQRCRLAGDWPADGRPGGYSLARFSAPGPPGRGVRTSQRALDVAAVPGRGRCRRPGPGMSGWPRSPTSATTSVARSGHVSQGITLCRQFVHTPPLASGLATLAWIRQVHGRSAGADGR